jgi:hypothetical protein
MFRKRNTTYFFYSNFFEIQISNFGFSKRCFALEVSIVPQERQCLGNTKKYPPLSMFLGFPLDLLIKMIIFMETPQEK